MINFFKKRVIPNCSLCEWQYIIMSEDGLPGPICKATGNAQFEENHSKRCKALYKEKQEDK